MDDHAGASCCRSSPRASLAGGLLAFTLSIDDFVITFFVAGPGSTTLPIRIYSMIKHGSPPLINALSTLLLVVTFVAVWLSQRLTTARRSHEDAPARAVLAAVLAALALPSRRRAGSRSPSCTSTPGPTTSSPSSCSRFEQEQGCQVVIDTFDSNEAMYAKLKAGATGYDLITPSSYMVQVMHRQGMLQPLDHAQLPNLPNVDPEFLKIAIDPEMHHSRAVHARSDRPRLPAEQGEGPDADLGDARPRRPQRPHDHAQRHARDHRRRAEVPRLQPQHHRRGELAQARDVVIRWKKNLAKFENEQYKTGLASGEFLLVHGYCGDILQVQAENDDIAFADPARRARRSPATTW